jgi:hypothetical protein
MGSEQLLIGNYLFDAMGIAKLVHRYAISRHTSLKRNNGAMHRRQRHEMRVGGRLVRNGRNSYACLTSTR